ncbi:hypothetical protein M407DRAFT_33253 [Tulasnella calospora MUT 4182]|uniref:HSF-type DNA-binding domain-containing protein n=1 Tax=Tulasnella calospora MUT 4182 TaxID=1051891 RepID=A0A0C3Q2M7_9AGAM|nr:hypothetical protein M407DRAFT_33253 [Tulasnella calospora MUT 4182]
MALDQIVGNRSSRRENDSRSSFIQDETLNHYVGWSKSKDRDAFLIPDIEAFVAYALPKHFKEMKQWGSFQKQLNNYGFERQDRGPDKALYVHSGDKFRQGRLDLLPDVRRRPTCQTPARSGQKRPSTPLTPTGDSSTVKFGSQKDLPLRSNKLEYDNEWLITEVLELKRKLESSEKRLRTAESRLEVTENQLQITERRRLEMQNQLFELFGTPERAPIGDGASNSVVDPGPAQLVGNVDVLYNTLNTPAVADAGLSTYHTGFLEDVSFESYFSTGMIYGSADLPLSSAFLAP